MMTTTTNSIENLSLFEASDYESGSSSNESKDTNYGDNNRFSNNPLSHPLDMNIGTVIVHCICSLTGLPLNLRLAFGIILDKELYTKPRNIILLSRVLCNIFTLIMAVDEIIYFFWPNNDVCRFFISVFELPYVLFFLNRLLALIERCVAVAYPIWYHERVTVQFTLSWLVVLNAALALAVNWIYITGVAPLLCEIQFSHAITLDVTLLFLCISCIVFRMIDYRQKNKIVPPMNVNDDNPRSVEMHNETLNQQPLSAGTETNIRAVIFDVLRLLLLPFSVLAFTFTHLVCLQAYSEANFCSYIVWSTPYFKELVTFHTVIHPVVFLRHNRHFFSESSSYCCNYSGENPSAAPDICLKSSSV